MANSCNVETLQREFVHATEVAQMYDSHRWAKGILAGLFPQFFGSMGLVPNLKRNVRTPEGKRIQPYLCVRKSRSDEGCLAVGNYFIGRRERGGYYGEFPRNIPWKKTEQLERHMKGANAEIGILAGFTSDERTMLRFYKLNEDGGIDAFNPEVTVPFRELTPENAQKICDLFGVR